VPVSYLPYEFLGFLEISLIPLTAIRGPLQLNCPSFNIIYVDQMINFLSEPANDCACGVKFAGEFILAIYEQEAK
jgi:hypothetical protein